MVRTKRFKILVTRSEPGASRTAAALRGAGFDPFVVPVLVQTSLPFDTSLLNDAKALAFTSEAAVKELAALNAIRPNQLVFTVGDATAAAARLAGYLDVTSAQGSVRDLVDLIKHQALCSPSDLILHVSGRHIAGDLVGDLVAAGFLAKRVMTYEMGEVDTLPDALLSALEAHEVDAALFHSPRGASLFSKLVLDSFSEDHTGLLRVHYFALSMAVADQLKIPGAAISLAANPTDESLLDCLQRTTG